VRQKPLVSCLSNNNRTGVDNSLLFMEEAKKKKKGTAAIVATGAGAGLVGADYAYYRKRANDKAIKAEMARVGTQSKADIAKSGGLKRFFQKKEREKYRRALIDQAATGGPGNTYEVPHGATTEGITKRAAEIKKAATQATKKGARQYGGDIVRRAKLPFLGVAGALAARKALKKKTR